jgi:hypothetical protein
MPAGDCSRINTMPNTNIEGLNEVVLAPLSRQMDAERLKNGSSNERGSSRTATREGPAVFRQPRASARIDGVRRALPSDHFSALQCRLFNRGVRALSGKIEHCQLLSKREAIPDYPTLDFVHVPGVYRPTQSPCFRRAASATTHATQWRPFTTMESVRVCRRCALSLCQPRRNTDSVTERFHDSKS